MGIEFLSGGRRSIAPEKLVRGATVAGAGLGWMSLDL